MKISNDKLGLFGFKAASAAGDDEVARLRALVQELQQALEQERAKRARLGQLLGPFLAQIKAAQGQQAPQQGRAYRSDGKDAQQAPKALGSAPSASAARAPDEVLPPPQKKIVRESMMDEGDFSDDLEELLDS